MSALALTGGHWEQRPGGIRVWVEDAPQTEDDWAADTIIAILTDLAGRRTTRVTGVICDDCGCLLTHADELCPACVLPWCRQQEIDHFWAVTWPRANRNGTGEQLIDEAQRRARKVA